MDTSVQRRIIHQDSEEQDLGTEDSDEEHVLLQDPGEFRYSKRVSVPAIPGLLIILGLVGELLLCFFSIGAVITFLLDYLGEKKRCVMVFVFTYFMCHILILYSVFPLIWLSWLNLVLVLITNIFVFLTGGWAILQFSAFRKEEFEISLTIEKLLFTAYPALGLALWIWAATSIVKITLVPYLTIALGFGLLQLFMVSTVSSFKLNMAQEDNIIDPPLAGLMAVFYLLSPTFLFIATAIFSKEIALFSKSSLVEIIFIACASLFLTTVLPVRQFTEHLGISYQQVLRARWVSGAIATILCYPILDYYGLASHYLPWLPAGIAAHVALGVCLSSIKFKVFSLIVLTGLSLLQTFWISRVPWSIKLFLADTIPIGFVYTMIWVNALICLVCAYMATHGERGALGFFISLQTIVFTASEMLLFNAKLYSLSIVLFSGLIALYLIYRLTVVERIPSGVSLLCTSIQLSKVCGLILAMLPYTEINSEWKVVTLFLLVLQGLKAFVFDSKIELSFYQVIFHLIGLSLTLALNIQPLLMMLSYYFLGNQPSLSDLTGIWLVLTGLSIMLMASIYSLKKEVLTKIGPLVVFIGFLLLIIQPSWTLTWLSLRQWANIISILAIVLFFIVPMSLPLPLVMFTSAVISVCPTYTIIMHKMYTPEQMNEALHLLYILLGSCSLTFVSVVVNWRTAGKFLERNVSFLCSCLAVFGILTIGVDYLTTVPDAKMSRPCWQVLSVIGCIVSGSLRLIGNKLKQEILVSDSDTKSPPMLPALGNVAAVCSYLILCMLSPAPGFIRDVWFCAAAAVLICLQRDQRLFQQLSNKNQMVPTIFMVAFVLWIQTFLHCDIWFSQELGSSLRSAVELIIIFITTPVYIVLWGILWLDEIRLNEKLVIFLMPLNSLLFLVGSTYTAWALAIFGMFSGIWMMSCKLPLEVDTPPEET